MNASHRKRSLLRGAAAVTGAAAAYVVVLRRWQLGWGATEDEAAAVLRGDELIPSADLAATRAITIRAPAERVWPWIAQIGQGRGGFYSYDLVENLVGCDIHSADRTMPEWQEIRVGDEIRLAPEVGLVVAVIEPGRALVLRGGVPVGKTAPPYDFTWAFVLREQPDGTTRLLVRERYGYKRVRPAARPCRPAHAARQHRSRPPLLTPKRIARHDLRERGPQDPASNPELASLDAESVRGHPSARA